MISAVQMIYALRMKKLILYHACEANISLKSFRLIIFLKTLAFYDTISINYRHFNRGITMKFNKKLILSVFLYEFIGATFILGTFYLTINNFININDTFINGVILFASIILSFIIYGYIYTKFRNNIAVTDCVIEFSLYAIFFTLLLTGYYSAGVHISILLIWCVDLLTLFIYNLIYFLEQKEQILIKAEGNSIAYSNKYSQIITILKIWDTIVLIGIHIFAIILLFYPSAIMGWEELLIY